MGYEYGIQKSKETKDVLKSDKDIHTKLDTAFDTITLIGENDTTLKCLESILKWSERYSILQDFGLKLDGVLRKVDKNSEMVILCNDLSKLCDDIIKSNELQG